MSIEYEQLRQLISDLLSLIRQQSITQHIRVTQTEMHEFADSEVGVEMIVITQWVETDAQIALDYWDRLGEAISEWARSLPPELAEMMLEHVTVGVCWPETS